MTNRALTFGVLGGYLTDAGRVDVEWLSNAIELDCMNTERLYREAVDSRRRPRGVAVEFLMDFVNNGLKFAGHIGYTATNAQVMKFDRQHGGGLELVLDELEDYIKQYRADR